MDRIPLFPLDVVLFPGELFGLHVFEERYLLMTEEVLESGAPIGIVLARQDQPDDRIEFEPEQVGTAARILSAERLGDRWMLQTVGVRRFLIQKVHSERMFQEADVEWLDEEEGDDEEARRLAEDLLEEIEARGGQVDWQSEGAHDPVRVSHAVAASLPVGLEAKQMLLEAPDAAERLRAEVEMVRLA